MNAVIIFFSTIFIGYGFSPSVTTKELCISTYRTQRDELLTQWREDSLGCKKIRTHRKAQLIIEKYGLKNKTISQIIELIGQPNKQISKSKNGLILRYYYNTCCKDGKINLLECDYSWVDFIFNNRGDNKCNIGGGVI